MESSSVVDQDDETRIQSSSAAATSSSSSLSDDSRIVSTFQPLHADLQAHVLSYLTEVELWIFHQKFPDAVRKTLSQKSTLHFSFLHQILPNPSPHDNRNNNNNSNNSNNDNANNGNNNNNTSNVVIHRNRQQVAVGKLLSLFEVGTNRLTYLECDSLRGVTGHDWLTRLPPSLHSLDLAGCVGLEPQLLIAYLERPQTNLRSLNLTDCSKISNSVVMTIANQQIQLEELWLGGCSQSINNTSIHYLLQKLRNLTHLDLRGLNLLSDLSGHFVSHLPPTLKSLNLTGCQQLRLASLEALEAIQYHLNFMGRDQHEDHGVVFPPPAAPAAAGAVVDRNIEQHWKSTPITRFSNLMHLVLDSIGTPRVGLCRGIVTYLAMGRALREVHLTGCEHVQDWEIEALAILCAPTLTCFQMRAGPIGDSAVIALANYCHLLAEVDLTSCFRVTDEGVMALTNPRRLLLNSDSSSSSFILAEDNVAELPYPPLEQQPQPHQEAMAVLAEQQRQQQDSKRTRRESRLRVLRLARLPHLTDQGIRSISRVKSLHVLDVHDCIEVSMGALIETTLQLPRLIEVNATNIQEQQRGGAHGTGSYLSQMRRMATSSPTSPQSNLCFPVGLRVVNGRYQTWGDPKLDMKPIGCCSVRMKGQRLDDSTPKAVMYHCIDCNLIPSVDRGVCGSCISKCHKGHKTFVGEWARFYCDCGFGCAGNECEVIFPSMQPQQQSLGQPMSVVATTLPTAAETVEETG